MEKATKEQKTEEISLCIQKIHTKQLGDWESPQFDGLNAGIYLCELPDSIQFLMVVNDNGGRCGLWIPIGVIVQNYVKEAKEKTIAEVLEHIGGIKAKLDAIESLANENNIILNEKEDVDKENAQTIAQSLVNLEKQIKELPRQTESQKSSLAEMAEAVVNIIKATK